MENSNHTTTIMSDLGPWDETTIAMLLGLSPDEITVQLLGKADPNNNNTHRAKLTFQSQEQMNRILQQYRGSAIPMTHGYHYYTFDTPSNNGGGDAIHRDGRTTPLHLQLMASTTRELERRAKRYCGSISSDDAVKFSKNNKRDRVRYHASLAFRLADKMQSRPVRYHRGVPVPHKGGIDELSTYLRSCDLLWPSREDQRKGVSASNYLTVRRNHPHEHDRLWELCRNLIVTVVPDAIYNALAITRDFRGSPHVDLRDTSYQHVIAVGDFEGGELCCEADTTGLETVAIDVNCRFGRIDGRAVHWVNPWSGDERYSIVYYTSEGRDGTERVSQLVHSKWMEEHPAQDAKRTVPMKKYRVRPMEDRDRLPSSLPILGLGCSSFSTFFSSEEDVALTVDTVTKDHPVVRGWIETIRHAVLYRGISLLDTAPWYGHGTSEKVVGFALDTILSNERVTSSPSIGTRTRYGSLPRSSLIINTKVGRYEADPLKQFDFSYDTTIFSVSRSLERMNCDYIDVLQLHDPEFAPSMDILMKETIPALLECREKGWAKAIGLTGYPLEVQHEILVKCSEKYNDGLVFDQALVYCHNNLHDMSLFDDCCFEPPSSIHAAPCTSSKKLSYAQFCDQSGIRLMCAAPLSMGLLTDKGPPDWHPASSSLKDACTKAAALCRSREVDISSLAVLYSLSQKEVGCTLIGLKDIREVDAAADLAVRFSSVDLDQSSLDQVLTQSEKDALRVLLDREQGPFTRVWADGDYRWDGKVEAEKFWRNVKNLQS